MKRHVVAVGSFDGVHRGHAAVLGEAVRHAHRLGVRSLAVSFATPPRMVLKSGRNLELLTTPPEREALIKSLGVDEIRFLHFSKAFSKRTPRQFFDDHLIRRFRATGIVVGPDFRFGHNRAGGLGNLKDWGGRAVPVWPVKTATAHAHKLSSRHIRKLVAAGRLAEAERELGHRYIAQGRVVRGNRLGRRLGFPTANLAVPDGKILPPGVYAVRVFKKSYAPGRRKAGWPGVCNIGQRPTINARPHKISFEVHILSGNIPALYGKHLWIEFISRLRSEKKFSSLEALSAQIRRDRDAAAKLLFTKAKK